MTGAGRSARDTKELRIGAGAGVISKTKSSQRTNVLVVLTDGLDTGRKLFKFDNNLIHKFKKRYCNVLNFKFNYFCKPDVWYERVFNEIIKILSTIKLFNYFQNNNDIEFVNNIVKNLQPT